jgi:DNA-directed RNA polymerase specialized sigma24 family protein
MSAKSARQSRPCSACKAQSSELETHGSAPRFSTDLVERACQGDPESQEILFGTLRPCLLHRAWQECDDATLAEDICQDACRDLLQRLPQLRDPARLVPWALTCVHNHARHTLRSLRNYPLLGGLDLEALSPAATNPPPWARMDFEYLVTLLRTHSAALGDPACRIAAFILEYCRREHDLPPVRATAKACRVSVGAVERGFPPILTHCRHVLRDAGILP